MRIPELERELIGQTTSGYGYWGAMTLIKKMLTSYFDTSSPLFPYDVIYSDGTPFHSNNIDTKQSYLVKAAKTSTKILKVTLFLRKMPNPNKIHQYDPDTIDQVMDCEVECLSGLVFDFPSFIEYGNERTKRLEVSFNKRTSNFYSLLNNANLNEKDFMNMLSEYNKMDAQSRRLIDARARK